MEKIIITNQKQYIHNGHSSKGNQLKWQDGSTWYKADYMGYEGLAETVVSRLLESSNIENHVSYSPVRILYEDMDMAGCKSANFLGEREELITLEKLFRQHTGMSLAKELAYFSDVKKRIAYTVDHVENYTGLKEFGVYLTKLLEMDAFFLNEDRHTNNIAVIYHLDDKEYRFCPYFDMGLSLFADTKEDFPLQKSLADCRRVIVAKPFSRDFDEQMDAANELYGSYLRFSLTKKELLKIAEEAGAPYEPAVMERVREVLRYQADKYRYMMAD